MICIVDNKERVIAINDKIIDHDFSGIAGKHNQGGQSAARFERNRNELLKSWYKETAQIMNQRLIQGVNGRIIIAGPSKSKLNIIPYINNMFKDKVEIMQEEYCNLAGIIQIRGKLC